jgi:HD-GYP domain-containing protein (c-di-GMP phosphodiesterase class II)
MRIIDNISTQLIQELKDHRDNFIDFILGGEILGKELAKSSLNTAILSALTAQELKLANHKILHIVMGSLLHDVGMLILPKEILEKRGSLSDGELKQIQNHPNFSAKIISKELFGPREVNLIALQHHERWDGKGYPEHTLGPDIDVGARIVSVADAFEAMVSNKSYRNSIVGYQAMKNLLSDNSRRFDPAVIRAFSRIMGIYPIGSIVLLNGDLLARVVGIHPEAPLRPVIRMLLDEFGKVYKADEGTIVDLLNEKSLFIKNAVDLKDLSGTNA